MNIDYTSDHGVLRVQINNINKEHFGCEASVSFTIHVKVKDSRPVNEKKILAKKDFTISGASQSIDLSITKEFYHYSGDKIRIVPILELRINDGYFFDTKIKKKVLLNLSKPPEVLQSSPNQILDPKDSFNLLFNIKSIRSSDKIIVLGLMVFGLFIAGVNMLVGFHDQFSPENLTYFYSHYDSDGEYSSPLVKAIMGSGSVGIGIWLIIKRYLRKYMTFRFRKIDWKFGKKDHIYNIPMMLTGRSLINLQDVTLKIVAGNIEKGQYTRGSGTNKRTVSFAHPVRAIELFSKKYSFIPKGTNIGEYLQGECSFENMYSYLYPEQKLSRSHGLEMHWEVQLIHDKLIDQELIGTKDICKYQYFLDA